MACNWRIDIRINFLRFSFLAIEHLAKKVEGETGNCERKRKRKCFQQLSLCNWH